MQEPENLLRQWKPRPPSPEVREKLFSVRAVEGRANARCKKSWWVAAISFGRQAGSAAPLWRRFGRQAGGAALLLRYFRTQAGSTAPQTQRDGSVASLSRYFGQAGSTALRRFRWNWLPPTAIGLFTLLAVVGGRTHWQNHLGAPDTNLVFSTITMNGAGTSSALAQADFPLSKTDLNLEQNVWREASFASTNYARTRSSMPSLPVGKTNRLLR